LRYERVYSTFFHLFDAPVVSELHVSAKFSCELEPARNHQSALGLNPNPSIKSLDPVEVHAATIGSAGCLQFDRAWAVYSLDGQLTVSLK
jgi:hypothetical protein